MDFKTMPLHLVANFISGHINLQMTKPRDDRPAIPCLVGDAGIGKTSILQKMFNNQYYNFYDIHYGLKPQEEVSGLPDFGEYVDVDMNGVVKQIKKTNWTLPDILSDVYELSKNGKPTVILFDDFHSAPPETMALGYEMFTFKKLRSYPFPKNSGFVLAMNCQGVKDLANPIPAPIVNRIAMYYVTVDFEYWKQNFAIPNKVNTKIISFLNNNKYRKYFQMEEMVNEPWASARSWTLFSNLLNEIENNSIELDMAQVLYLTRCHVGESAAAEFATYYVLYSSINVQEIFSGNIKIPTDSSNQYIYILSFIIELINKLSNKLSKEEKLKLFEICAEVIIKMGEVNKEIATVGLKELSLNSVSNKYLLEIRKIIQIKNPSLHDDISKSIKAV